MVQDERGSDRDEAWPGPGLSSDARGIIAAFPFPVFLYGNDGVVVSASPAAEAMIGGSPAGLSIEQLIERLAIRHPDGTVITPGDLPAAQVLNGKRAADSPLLVTARDGSIFSIRASASRVGCDRAAIGVLSAWSDVTDLTRSLELEHQRRARAETTARQHEAMAETLAQQNEELLAQEHELRQQLDALALSREALSTSEQRVRRTLERLLSPGDELPNLDLVDILDPVTMHELLDEFQRLTGVVAGIVDPEGRIVVGTRLQSCCSDFHRGHPETLRKCIESDLLLSGDIPPGESQLYQCRNNLWEIATPIMLGDRRLGLLIFGQFFFMDEELDESLFRDQARRHGFDEISYLEAIRAVPRLSRATVDSGITFLRRLAGLISSLGYSNLRLARTLVERDALTAELERSREHLARAEAIAHLGSWELDLVTHELSWSDEVYRILGLQPGDCEPSFDALVEATHPDDRVAVVAAYSAHRCDEQNGYAIEHRIVQKGSGQIRWVHEKCDHQRDVSGRSIRLVGLYHDITDRKQVEHSLQEYAARLQASNEELQSFAYVASHDLQEPLRSIVSFSQLIDRRYRGRLDADADEYLGYIVEGGRRLQELIKDLLLVSRVETGARPLEPVDAGVVVDSVLHTLGVPGDRDGATVDVGPLPVVMADPSQLELVFLNLIGNALKYRRPDVPPRVRVRADRESSYWRFSVEDNGIGIDPEYFDRIFVMFQRLHTRDEYEGTGIGLAIVKKIVEGLGGSVRVESVPGQGSTFTFTIPAV